MLFLTSAAQEGILEGTSGTDAKCQSLCHCGVPGSEGDMPQVT